MNSSDSSSRITSYIQLCKEHRRTYGKYDMTRILLNCYTSSLTKLSSGHKQSIKVCFRKHLREWILAIHSLDFRLSLSCTKNTEELYWNYTIYFLANILLISKEINCFAYLINSQLNYFLASESEPESESESLLTAPSVGFVTSAPLTSEVNKSFNRGNIVRLSSIRPAATRQLS